VHLVGFIINKFVTMHGHRNVKKEYYSPDFVMYKCFPPHSCSTSLEVKYRLEPKMSSRRQLTDPRRTLDISQCHFEHARILPHSTIHRLSSTLILRIQIIVL
jgi:hypothetical protein